jgi:subtilase family serine protease
MADIVSDSWGEPELASDPTMDPVYDKIFMTGALEGIGYYFSSGDGGDEKAATGAKQTDMSASLPWVTAVGGTSLAVGADGQYLFETGWGADKAPLSPFGTSWSALPGTFLAGAGGGTSSCIAQPSYQALVVPSSLSLFSGSAHRVVPDIAAVADSSVYATTGTITTLRTLGRDSPLHATVGYDDVTGVGSPSAGYIPSYSPNGGAFAAR